MAVLIQSPKANTKTKIPVHQLTLLTPFFNAYPKVFFLVIFGQVLFKSDPCPVYEFEFWCLMLLSAIFQLYHGDQF
jgi:hypothetical protein